MVTANVYRSVDGVERALDQKNLRVLAPLAVIGAGGVFLAQEVVDLVMPELDMDPDPTTPTGLGAAAALKLVLAILLVAVGQRVGGQTMSGLGAVLGVGVLISAGADAIDMLQRGSLPGMQPQRSTRSRNRSRSRNTRRSSRTKKSSGSSSGNTPAPSPSGSSGTRRAASAGSGSQTYR